MAEYILFTLLPQSVDKIQSTIKSNAIERTIINSALPFGSEWRKLHGARSIKMFKITRDFACIALSGASVAQLQTYNHAELKWRTIETEHFYIHFHEGTERTAGVVAKIVEDIYEPITSLYQYEPDGKIHFIIRDHDDESNGAAFYYDNKVEIWAPALDFLLRGSHNWLRKHYF